MADATYFELAQKGSRVFLDPGRVFPWEEIVNGLITDEGKSRRKFYAVAPNTFRSFHRVDKSKPGAFPVFKNFFTDNKGEIIERLTNLNNRADFHALGNEITRSIRPLLWNIKPSMIESYNKIRKPVDLYFEHLVAMAQELNPIRPKLVPFLSLPLDSQMIASKLVFGKEDLDKANLSRRSTYTHVKQEKTYLELQQAVQQKAKLISREKEMDFYPIYFDLLWNDRYCRNGSYLFDLN